MPDFNDYSIPGLSGYADSYGGDSDNAYPNPPSQQQGGDSSSILNFLGYFDRPRNAIATGVNEAMTTGNPLSFLSGAYSGLMGDKHTSWGDVAGIPETTPEDSWADYLTKGGSRLALDVVLDPLNLLFGTGAITKGLGISKAGKSGLTRSLEYAAPEAYPALRSEVKAKIAGSPLFRWFGHDLPGGINKEGVSSDKINALSRGLSGEFSDVPTTRMATQTQESLAKAQAQIMEQFGREATPEEIREIGERTGKERPIWYNPPQAPNTWHPSPSPGPEVPAIESNLIEPALAGLRRRGGRILPEGSPLSPAVDAEVTASGKTFPNLPGIGEWNTGVPEAYKGIYEALLPMIEKKQASREGLIGFQKDLGIPEAPIIKSPDINYIPQTQAADKSLIRRTGHFGDVAIDPTAEKASREIMNYVDENGFVRAIGKLGDERTKVFYNKTPYVSKKLGLEDASMSSSGQPTIKTGESLLPDSSPMFDTAGVQGRSTNLFLEDGTPVFPVQASAYEKTKAFSTQFDPDVIGSLTKGIKSDDAKFAALKFLEGLMREGAAIPLTRRMEMDPTSFMFQNAKTTQGTRDVMAGALAGEPGLTKKGFSVLNIPGLKNESTGLMGFQVPDFMVPYLENKLGIAIDPSASMGTMADLLKRFNQSAPGQTLQDWTTWWKRTTLAHPGWFTGNVASNQGFMYEAGVEPWNLLTREAQAAIVQNPFGKTEKAKDIFGGLSNSALKTSMEDYKLLGLETTQYGKEGLEKAGADYGGKMSSLAERLPGFMEPVGQGVAKAGEFAGQQMDKVFKLGSWFEENARLGVAIDYLKKNAPEIGKMSVEEQTTWLQKAAEYGKNAMIDYSKSTPLESQLGSILPFYKWARGITGITADMAMRQPQKLANLERGMEFAFTPMDKKDKEIASSWVGEGGPIMGAFGGKFAADDKGRPGMAMTGRFIPQGDTERLTSRPLDYLTSMVNPAIKGPLELLANRNSFKNAPIDRLATGPLESLTAPLLGQPHEMAKREVFGNNVSSGIDYLLSQVPGGRYLTEAQMLSHASGLTPDPYREPMAMKDYLVWLGSGGKVFPFDRGKEMLRNQNDYNKSKGTIMSDMKYAAMRGDTDTVAYYQQMLLKLSQKHGERMGGSGSPDGYRITY